MQPRQEEGLQKPEENCHLPSHNPIPRPTLPPNQPPRSKPNPETISHVQNSNKSKKLELEMKHEHVKPDKTKGSEQEQDQGEQLRHIHYHLHQPVDQRVQELKNTTSENPKPHEFSPSKKIKLEKLKISKLGGERGVKILIEKFSLEIV